MRGTAKRVKPGGEIGLATARAAVPPAATPPPEPSKTLLELLDMSLDELTQLVRQNPSLYGMLLGYAAEMKLEKMWFAGRAGVSSIQKYDDHDRTRKGDRVVVYKGVPIKVECKSLQTSMIENLGKGRFRGKVQCDASDRRTIRLPDGSTVTTTCLRVGEFDILAANLFAFEKKWKFVFALNQDLPRTSYSKYTAKQQKYLLASLVPVSWPPEPPFHDEPFSLMDRIVRERGKARTSST
jgi:hypothetical protein